MSKKRIDLTGQRFGSLVALKKVPPPNNVKNKTKSYWLCKCDCGNQKVISQYHLKSGNISSCECLQKKRISEFNSNAKKKYNNYDLESEEYGVGYDVNGKQFIFDKDDFEKFKKYCWHICRGYAVTEVEKGNTLYLHKLILENFEDVDHINGNTLDNRKSNLRKATHQQNMMNQKIHKNNTSGVSGVTFNKRNQCWVARIGYRMKRIYLGSFSNYEDAVKARKEAEKKYFKEWNRI